MRLTVLGVTVAAAAAISSPGYTADRPALSAASYTHTVAPPGSAVIGTDDTLDVAVFQIPDLSRTVQVDSTGKILLPLIGQVQAAGLTPEELSGRIATELGKKYVRDPQVTIIVKDSTSQKVTVDGAVNQPGIYPVTGPTTLMQAVALARGTDSKRANTHKVAVFRMTDGARVATNYDLSAIRAGKIADPQIYPRDVIVVAGSGSKTFLNNLGNVIPMVALFRPY